MQSILHEINVKFLLLQCEVIICNYTNMRIVKDSAFILTITNYGIGGKFSHFVMQQWHMYREVTTISVFGGHLGEAVTSRPMGNCGSSSPHTVRARDMVVFETGNAMLSGVTLSSCHTKCPFSGVSASRMCSSMS